MEECENYWIVFDRLYSSLNVVMVIKSRRVYVCTKLSQAKTQPPEILMKFGEVQPFIQVKQHSDFFRLVGVVVFNLLVLDFLTSHYSSVFNPLNPKLNPIFYLLALLGAHHFLHVSRIRVKLLTFGRLMSYIYIWSTHS